MTEKEEAKGKKAVEKEEAKNSKEVEKEEKLRKGPGSTCSTETKEAN